uniref:RNA-directed DNA polymerase n=1 Tax=Cacopsylla melanoneura TaxID=428564 RepID=A0A8D8QR86_9HEMI
MKYQTNTDEVMAKLIDFYTNGWPGNTNNLSGEIAHFVPMRSSISVQDGLVFYEEKLIVPKSMRGYLLKLAHETHLGYDKIKDQLCNRFYWPGIKSDLINMIRSCLVCQTFQRSNMKDPLMSHSIPTIPFMKLGIDFAEFNSIDYLVIIDYYSRWIEVFKVKNKTVETVISCLKQVFCRFGIPQTVVADNVPFNSYSFKSFAKDWGFDVHHISPHHSQSNGLVEKAVGIVKSMLKKCENEKSDLSLYLLNYRNSPVAGLSFSPAQLLMSKSLRTKFPTNSESLKPRVASGMASLMEEEKNKQCEYFNKRAKNKELTFNVGEKVLVQNVFNKRWELGVIVSVCDLPRSYMVRMLGSNRLLRRNTIFLKKFYPPKDDSAFNSNKKLTCPNRSKHLELSSEFPGSVNENDSYESSNPQNCLCDQSIPANENTNRRGESNIQDNLVSQGQECPNTAQENITYNQNEADVTEARTRSDDNIVCNQNQADTLVRTKSGRTVRPPKRLNL